MNRPSSESHQVYLYGRVARKEEQSSTDHLGEFDRFRTCDHPIHILTLYPLSYKLHVMFQMDSNHHLQTRNLPCYHYTMEQSPVAPEGVEPPLTEPKPVVLPLYHRAVLRSGGRTRTYGVKRQRIYSPPSLPLEHSRLYGGASWN